MLFLLLALVNPVPADPVAPPPDPPASPTAASPAATVSLPPEELVRQLRVARIKGLQGDRAAERDELLRAVEAFPEEPLGWHALLEYEQRHGTRASQAAALRRLRPALATGTRAFPYALLVRIAVDPLSGPDELAATRDHAVARRNAEPGDPRWLRLLVDLEQRLGDKAAAADRCRHLLALQADSVETKAMCAPVLQAAGFAAEADAMLKQLPLEALVGMGSQLDVFVGRAAALAAAREEAGLEALWQEAAACGLRPPEDGLVASALDLRDAGQDPAAEAYLRWLARKLPGGTAERVHVTLYGTADERRQAAERAAESLGFTGLTSAGAEALKQGDAARALDLFERAIAKDGSSPVGWYNVGIAARKLRAFARAEQAFARAAALQPGFFSALSLLAEMRCELRDFAGAEAALKAAEAAPGAKPDELARRRARCVEVQQAAVGS